LPALVGMNNSRPARAPMLDVIGDGKGHGRERQSPRRQLPGQQRSSWPTCVAIPRRPGDLHPRSIRAHQLDGFTPELRRVLPRTPHAGLLPGVTPESGGPPKRVKVIQHHSPRSLWPQDRPGRQGVPAKSRRSCVSMSPWEASSDPGPRLASRRRSASSTSPSTAASARSPGRALVANGDLGQASKRSPTSSVRAAARTRSTERSAVVPGQTWCQSEREAVRDPSSLGVATHARDGARPR
jgi:hypothetical protein